MAWRAEETDTERFRPSWQLPKGRATTMSDWRRLAGRWIMAPVLAGWLITAAPVAGAEWSMHELCSRACRWSGYGWGDGYHAQSRGSAVILDTVHGTEPSAPSVPASVPTTAPNPVSAVLPAPVTSPAPSTARKAVPAPPVGATAVARRESVVVAEPVAEPVRRLPVFPAPRVLPSAAEPQRRLPPVAERPAHGQASSGWWRAAMLGP